MHQGWYQSRQLLHLSANDSSVAPVDPSSFSPHIAQADDGNDSSLTHPTSPLPPSFVLLSITSSVATKHTTRPVRRWATQSTRRPKIELRVQAARPPPRTTGRKPPPGTLQNSLANLSACRRVLTLPGKPFRYDREVHTQNAGRIP